MDKGRVSVVIPTYGGTQFINRSVKSVLNQTYKNIDIIVIDDNGKGTKNQALTEQILSEYIEKKQIIYIVHERNINGSAARNTGAKTTRSEYITFLDDDDEYYPEKVENQILQLQKHDEVMLTWCGGEVYVNDKLSYERRPKKDEIALLFDVLMHKTVIGSNSIMIRREAYEVLDGFDESFKRHQDWEFSARAVAKFNVIGDNDNGFKHYIVGRNEPQDPEMALKYRKHYLEKMEPLLSKLTRIQREKVRSSNLVNAMLFYLKTHKYGEFVRVFIREKLGVMGVICLIRCCMLLIKNKISIAMYKLQGLMRGLIYGSE